MKDKDAVHKIAITAWDKMGTCFKLCYFGTRQCMCLSMTYHFRVLYIFAIDDISAFGKHTRNSQLFETWCSFVKQCLCIERTLTYSSEIYPYLQLIFSTHSSNSLFLHMTLLIKYSWVLELIYRLNFLTSFSGSSIYGPSSVGCKN